MRTHKQALLAILAVTAFSILETFAADKELPPGVVRIHDVNETRWFERTLDSAAVDWSLYPQAYGVLASERLISPVDLSDWPVKVGSERQLFLDNFIVASAANVTRTVHQPVKYSGNPVMSPQQPWENEDTLIVLHVQYDQSAAKFRMWYSTRHPDCPTGRFPTLYAESSDGLTWHRPVLGLLEHNSSKDNNWVCYGRMHGLMHHPEAVDPQRKFLAAMLQEVPVAAVAGLYLFASPDGLRWTKVRDEPIVYMADHAKTLPALGLGDTSIVRWDQKLNKYICDTKIVHGQRGPNNDYRLSFRTRAVTTSDDLIHWSAPRMTIYPDALDGADAQIYSNISFPYESQWIGLLRMYHFDRTNYKQVDVQLTSSRDGLNWTRVGNRELFLPLGNEESWERDYTDVAHDGPLLINDELWFFYRGSRKRPGKEDRYEQRSLGLAKLRRDGFVSIDAGADKGVLTTRPLTLAGNTLHVNAKAPGGGVKVGLLGMNGKPIPGYGIDDCRAFSGDETRQIVRWKSRDDVSAARMKAQHVRVRFELTNAELYSFWVD